MNKETNSNEHQWRLLVLILRQIAIQKGISQEQIAERTGMKQQNISRIFSLQYSPSLKNFIAIAKAIGVNFLLEDKERKTDLNQIFELAMAELGRRVDKFPKN